MKLKKIFLSLSFLVGLNSVALDKAAAQECFLGEVRMFAGNFAPRSWALAEGQLLQISQNSALFSILGTTYGGDGRVTFGLPDLRGRTAVGPGAGPGLGTNLRLGQKFGAAETTRTNLAHQHVLTAAQLKDGEANNSTDAGAKPRLLMANVAPTETDIPLAGTATGGSGNVDNHQPSLAINHIICIQGTFPSRN